MVKLAGNPPTRREIADKVNELIDFVEAFKNAQLVPTNGGKIFVTEENVQFNLNGFLTRDEAQQLYGQAQQ
jgi:hypothetical protein